MNMDLHTDGTYIKETIDWLLTNQLEESNVEGGGDDNVTSWWLRTL